MQMAGQRTLDSNSLNGTAPRNEQESPQSGNSEGFLVRYGELLRLGCGCLFIPIQPFAYVVANYSCYDRDKKTGKYFSHRNSPPFCWRFGSLGIISHIFTLQNNFYVLFILNSFSILNLLLVILYFKRSIIT